MSDKKFFSIIVTFYNNERYIKKCLNSVLTQVKSNYEVIIVDDESTDNSKTIINEIIKNYDNVRLIENKHSGISVARNVGIENSVGKYIIFIDGDDWIEISSLKNIEAFLKNNPVNILLMDTIKYYEIKDLYFYEQLSFNKLPIKEKEIYNCFIKNDVISRPWRFITKRDFIIKNKLYFYPGLLHEDEEWTAKLLFNIDSISYYSGNYYIYRKHEGSITSTKTNQNYKDYLKIVNILYKNIYLKNISKYYKKYLQYSMFRCLRNVYSKYNYFDDNMKKNLDDWYAANYKCYIDISKYSKCNFILQKIFGYKKGFYYYKLIRKLLKIKRNKRKEVMLDEKIN